MKRLWIAGMLMAVAAAAWPQAASADWRGAAGIGVSRDRGPWGGSPAFRYGYDRGWREGSEEGQRDGRRCRDPRFWRDGDYRDGHRGYRQWMGFRGDYVAGYRQGYESGYRRAYAASRPGWRGRGRWDQRDPYGYERP
jgi:hypothetical protein